MATNLPGQSSDPAPPHAVLGKVRILVTLGLLVLLILCLTFSWTTRDAMGHLAFLQKPGDAGRVAEGQNTIVDLSPWQTAQALAAMAVTAEETELAREAERLADHQTDQAFAAALRQASLQHYSLSGEALATAVRDAGHKHVVYLRSMQESIEYLLQEARPGDAIMTIGAGNVSRASNELMVLLGTEHPSPHAR